MSRFKQSEDVLKIIDFSQRHRWAKYICVGAVGAKYVSDVILSATTDVYIKLRRGAEAAAAIVLPAVRRIFSASVAAAFGMMMLPFGAFAEEADASDADMRETAAAASEEITEAGNELPAENKRASDGEEKAGEDGTVGNKLPAVFGNIADSVAAFADSIKNNAGTEIEYTVLNEEDILDDEAEAVPKEVSADFAPSDSDGGSDVLNIYISCPDSGDKMYMENLDGGENRQIGILSGSSEGENAIAKAFKGYGIMPEEMNIKAMDINIFGGDNPEKAVISVKIPDDMLNHLDDLRAVRLDGGKIEILNSEYSVDKDGSRVIVFETEHLSTFALVSYADKPEDMESGAGIADLGGSVGMAEAGFDARVKRRREAQKSRKYRITKRLRKADLIF